MPLPPVSHSANHAGMIKRLFCLSLFALLTACAGTGQVMPPEVKAAGKQTVVTNPEPGTTPPTAPGQAKIALLLPLSGPHAQLGQAMLQAAQLALFDLGTNNFQLLPRDTGDTAEGATQAADASVHDGAQLILGPIFAPSVRAASPVAAHAGINMIAFSTDATLAGGNTFIFGFVPQGEVQRIVQYSAGQNVRRIGVLAAEGDYGDAVLAAYTKEAAKDGVTTVQVARLPAGRAQRAGLVAGFAHSGAMDGVLIAAGGEQAKAASDLLTLDGLPPGKVRRLGTGLWDDARLSTAPSLNGAWFAGSDPALRKGFEKRYAETYGQPPQRLATLAYDATALAAVLAKKGGDSRRAFERGPLGNTNGFAGVDGVFRFPASEVAERGLGILTFQGGAIKVQDPAPQTFQPQ